jgi:MFS family permease
MFWSSPGQTYLISLYGAEIRAAFALSHADFGGLYSLGTLLSAALLIVSGRLVDRFDLRRLSLAIVVFIAAACWFMSFTSGAVTLAIAFFLLRQSGQGLMSHVATTSMSRYFETARGKATAVAALGFVCAEACLPILTIVLIEWVGWRMSWRITGSVALLMLVPATLWLLRSHHSRHQRYMDTLRTTTGSAAGGVIGKPRHQWTRAEVLRDRRFYMAMPACLAPSFFFTGFFFHQVHLVDAKGWDLSWWGSWFAAYAVASLVATSITGPLVDKLGALRLMPLFPLPMACGLLTLAASDSLFVAIAFLLLNGITAGWSITVMGPLWAEVYGVLHLGAIKALGSALSVFSSALSPFLLGWLIDAGASIEGLAQGSAVYVISVCVLAFFAFRGDQPVKPRAEPVP